jgi:hypothetical protein
MDRFDCSSYDYFLLKIKILIKHCDDSDSFKLVRIVALETI